MMPNLDVASIPPILAVPRTFEYVEGDTPESALEKVPTENERAWQAFKDYARMGLGSRSIPKLIAQYKERELRWKEEGLERRPPTLSKKTMSRWSYIFAWADRIKRYDLAIEAEDKQKSKELRLNWRARRYEILNELASKVVGAIGRIDEHRMAVAMANGSDGIQVVKALLSEVRREFEPQSVVENGIVASEEGRGVDLFQRAESLVMLAITRKTTGEVVDV